MQATESVKTVINNHLQGLAEKDPLFAETLKKPAKNINDCITYIFNQVKKTGSNWFADDEIFGMAVHYYDEDNIEVGKAVTGKVVAGHNDKATKTTGTTPSAPVTKKPAKKAAAPDEQIYLF